MMDDLWELCTRLPDYLGGHILLSLAALGVGLGVSVPLGVIVSRRPKLAESMLTVAGILQTVPTLALLALMVPLLNGAIGFLPAFIALTLYSVLPILAATITGIRGIDPNLTEAARGLGMNDWQALTRVQLPLAAPVIISGIRTATVLVVGTATLALPVGGLSLGNYIFSGLSMSNITAVVFGCILTAALAIYMDQMVHLFELAAARRSRALAGAATLGFAVVVGIGLYEPILRVLAPAPVIVASAPFTEQFVLSEVMASLAQKEGLQVDQRQAMYETIQFEALKRNRIDCCVNYTGNIWVTIMRKDMATGVSQEEMYAAIAGELAKHDIVCAGKLGFQNNYVFAVDRRRAKGITRISELGHMKHQNQYVVAGDEQFFNRPEWRQVREAYRLKFRDIKQMDVSLIYGALEQNQVQVICAYSSDGRLSAKDILVLEDDAHVLPSYDAILLYSRKGAANAALRKSLAPLTQQRLDDDTMRAANLSIDVGVGAKRKTPREAALDVLGKLDS